MENNNSSEEIKTTPDSPRGYFEQWYRDSISVLTEPIQFFKTRYQKMSFNQALVLGIVLSWIAAFLDWITRAIKHESLMDGLLKIKEQLHSLPIWKDLPETMWTQGNSAVSILPEWGMEGMKMLITPFHSLVSFFVYGVIFWLGAVVLVAHDNPAKKQVTINNVVKITALASTASIVGAVLGFLPIGIGNFVGWIFHTALLVIGFSEVFNISRLRGLAVVFLPTFVTIIFFSCLVGVVIALFAGVIATLLH